MNNKKVTINDIAKLANTSKTTVSFYLNDKFSKMSPETKQRIESAIKETNYRPSSAARSLNNMPTKTIGIVIGDITNNFSNKLVKGIDDEAIKNNYQIILGSSSYDSERELKYIEKMLYSNVDGLIIQPTKEFVKSLPIIKDYDKPIIFIDSYIDDINIPCVKSNNFEASYDSLLKHYEEGYDNFILITANPVDLSVRRERVEAFRKVVSEYNISNKEILLPSNLDALDEVYFDEIIKYSIDKDRKNLIFIPNCWALPKIYSSLKSYFPLIPETIAILGFDNEEWLELITTPISSIIQPAYLEGQRSMQVLLDLIDGKPSPSKLIELKSRII